MRSVHAEWKGWRAEKSLEEGSPSAGKWEEESYWQGGVALLSLRPSRPHFDTLLPRAASSSDSCQAAPPKREAYGQLPGVVLLPGSLAQRSTALPGKDFGAEPLEGDRGKRSGAPCFTARSFHSPSPAAC